MKFVFQGETEFGKTPNRIETLGRSYKSEKLFYEYLDRLKVDQFA